MKQSKLFLLMIFVLFTITGCANILSQEEETGIIRFTSGSSSRAVATPEQLTNYTFTGTHNGKTEILGQWNTFAQMTAAEIEVKIGMWDFTMEAENKISNISIGYSATIKNKEIMKGNNKLLFNLKKEGIVSTAANLATVYTELAANNTAQSTTPFEIKITDTISTKEQWTKVRTALATVQNKTYTTIKVNFAETFNYNKIVKASSTAENSTAVAAISSVIILPETKKVGDFVFNNCTNLSSITLPGATQYGDRTFVDCAKLSNIDFKGTMAQWCSFDHHTSRVYPQAGGLTSTNYKLIIDGKEITNTLTIPEGITTFGRGAFRDLSKLTTVNFPANKITLGDRMFANCSSLNNVEIPSYITDLPQELFYQCKNLSNITFKDSTKIATIGPGAFAYTTLTTFTFPANITTIQGSVLRNCTSLTSVTIPAKATTINADAFSGCTALTTLTIPANITKLGKRFIQNSGVTTLNFETKTGWNTKASPTEITPIEKATIENATTMATECKTGLYVEKELIRK